MNLFRPALLAAAASIGACALAQEDVTSTYLVNPSFEADAAACVDAVKVVDGDSKLRGWKVCPPTGWQVAETGTDLLLTADCITDNNFGSTTIADGDYAFYQRVGWTNTTSTISQTTTVALPVGTYELKFQTKGFYANDASSSATFSAKTSAGKSLKEGAFSCVKGSANCMASSNWDTRTLHFSVEEAAPVTFTLSMTWLSGGSCIAFDNFQLIKLSDTPEDPNTEIEGDTEDSVESPTEGKLSHDFVSEADMKADLLQMLATFMTYAKSIYTDAANNSAGDATGYFKGNSAGNSNEDGVRSNADHAMVAAFVYKYGDGKVTLPAGITREDLKNMAIKALRWGYSTHKANKLIKTTNSAYWGSTAASDSQWESSLWTMSLAYASFFLADELTQAEKDCVYNMIKAECNYELERNIPVGYNGDTKAEENGWETNVLACALGLYPNDPLATKWFERLREFAINCYSQADDAQDKTVIDPDYDQKTVADLYKGACLYDDYTLQNHNYFHTSYQNVVMQELGESHLALALFQGASPKWKTNALMHNNQEVMDEVLIHLALADGELAMPNGNDWSMFLFDQITSYTTAACFLSDPNALLLENMAYKNIKARQTTTADGSWLLNSDIGPRRMGVEAHRVMMTYLMHDLASTKDLKATSWADFSRAVEPAKIFKTQNIVRANTPDRYTIFSWSAGLKNYTGYFVPNDPNFAKIVVPYKANGTGNLLGWYSVSGKSTDVSNPVGGIYNLKGNSYSMNGKLGTNAGALSNAFAIYSTPGNALIYIDYVTSAAASTVTKEYGGLLAISVDPFTKTQRTLYHQNGRFQSDGSSLKAFNSQWVNVDNAIGVVVAGADNRMAFGEKGNNCSVATAKLITSYNADSRQYKAGDIVDARGIVYYSSVSADATKDLCSAVIDLKSQCAPGWNGLIASDPDGVRYLLIANFMGNPRCEIKDVLTADGCPVFSQPTAISAKGSTCTFVSDVNNSIADALRVYLKGEGVTAYQVEGDSCAVIAYASDGGAATVAATILADGKRLEKSGIAIPAGSAVKISARNGAITVEAATLPQEEEETYFDITDKFFANPSFEADKSWAKVGSCTLNGTVYDPCYLNELAASDSKFPQVLPVEDWTAASSLDGSSNFAVLYSMPYSPTMYCVSPSDLGNSASIMSAPALFPEAGERCLSVLNSWTFGSNAITKTATLPAGNYKLKFLAQYVCANESGRPAIDQITTGNNVNYSLCGVKIGEQSDYRFPEKANAWEQIVIPFTLDNDGSALISLGLRTTASVGAANNTRLYLDDVRLYSEKELVEDGLSSIGAAALPVNVYNLQGLLLRSGVAPSAATAGLPSGLYIVGSRKVYVP